MRPLVAPLAFCLALAACSGGSPAPETPAAPSSASVQPSAQPAPAASSAAPAPAPAPSASAPAPAPDQKPAPAKIKARADGKALVVEVDGVEAKITARATKAKGGHGVEIDVSLRATDGSEHVVSGGGHPVVLTGSLSTESKQGSSTAALHEGGVTTHLPLKPGADQKVKRAYPEGEQKPLVDGQSLSLMISAGAIETPSTGVKRPITTLATLDVEVKKGKVTLSLKSGDVEVKP